MCRTLTTSLVYVRGGRVFVRASATEVKLVSNCQGDSSRRSRPSLAILPRFSPATFCRQKLCHTWLGPEPGPVDLQRKEEICKKAPKQLNMLNNTWIIHMELTMGKCLGHTIVNLVLADSMLMRISLYSRLFLVTSLRVTPEILQVLILACFSMRVGGWGRGG